MKTKFSKSWNASKQPRKQRKYIYNAPLHLKRKRLSANLDKPLRVKYGIRNIEVRKGDEVKIMRGKFKKKQGKVTEVDIKKMKVVVEGIQITKKDGTKINVGIHPSKIKIISMDTNDVKRLKQIKKKVEIKTEIKQEKENAPKAK